MKISFYLEFNILNKFEYICNNLDKIDDFYFERTIFSLTNFSFKYLVNNHENNLKYLIKYIDYVFRLAKRSLCNLRVITCMNSLYVLFNSIDETKQEKLPKILIKLIASCRNFYEKNMSLDLISKFINISEKVKNFLANHLEYFYLQLSDKEYS